jgi:hypothetical protein
VKTKLTLFVTVLAVALFGMGCASTPKSPPVEGAVKWNGHWYALYSFEGGKTWAQAKKHCEDLGGHLVCIESKGEEDFLFTTYINNIPKTDPVMLGATDEVKEGDWRWVNGKSLGETYQNWRKGMPDNDGGGQHVLRIDFSSDGWKWDDDYSHTLKKHFICEWE